ncbi:MAG: PAS domain S-box protein, partial [Thermodesulfovibrionales bacterium]
MKQPGIRRKVVAGVILLSAVSFLLLGIALSLLIFRSEKAHLLSLQREIAGFAGNEMLWDIHELDALLSVSAEHYEKSRLNGQSEAAFLAQVLASRHMAHHNILDELSLLDINGKERARLSRSAVFFESDLRDLSEADEFILPMKTGEIYFGPVLFEEGVSSPHMLVALPVLDARSYTVSAVLMGSIRLNRIWENAVERSVGKAGMIFITSEDGKVLAHPDQSVIFRNTYFKPKAPDGIQGGLNGEKVMLASTIVHVGSRTFVVYASLPLREVLALSLQTLSATAVFLAIFLFCSIAVSLFAVNRLLRPIEDLAGSARDISAGRLSPTVQLERDDEIGELSGALSTMTNKLIETIRSLEQRNELLNNILNSLTHPFYVIDVHDYTIKLANPAARFGSLTGHQTCYELTHHSSEPCRDAEHPCVIQQVMEVRGPVRVEHVHYDSQGRVLIMEIHGYPIFDAEGSIVQVIEYNIDITGRKKVEEKLLLSEQRSRAITATANDAIIMMDPDGRVSIWNPASEVIFGYTEEEALGKYLHDLIMPGRYREVCSRGMEEFSRTGRGSAVGTSTELMAKRKDGSEFPVELSLSALQMKGSWHAVGIVRDITQRKLAESRILESLREKELLLHEIHHRV